MYASVDAKPNTETQLINALIIKQVGQVIAEKLQFILERRQVTWCRLRTAKVNVPRGSALERGRTCMSTGSGPAVTVPCRLHLFDILQHLSCRLN